MRQIYCRKTIIALVFLLVVALIIRVGITGVIIGFNQTGLTSDDREFEGIGWTLVQTGRYAVNPDTSPTARRVPALPLLLAGIYGVFGHQQAIAKIILIFISSSTVIVTFLLGKEIGDRRVGLVAALLVALDPFAWIFSGVFYSETVFTFIMTLTVLFLVRIFKQPRLSNLLLLGVTLGICTLTRANGLVAVGASVMLLLLNESQSLSARLRHAGIVMGIVLILMLPWVGRNFWTFHRFIPTTSQAGEVLLGFYNNTCLKYHCNEWIAIYIQPEHEEYHLADLDEMTRNDVQVGLAMASIRAHPVEWLKLLPGKVVRFWTHDLILPNTRYRSYPPLAFSSLQIIYYHYLLIFGLIGLFMLYLTGRRREFVILMSFLAIFSLMVLILWGDARIRMPLHPLLAVAGAYALTTTYDKMTGKMVSPIRREG